MTQTSTPSLPPGNSTPPDSEPRESGGGLRRTVIIAVGGFIAVTLLLFVAALILAIADVERAGAIIQLIRDLVIILLALEGILIVLALAILILQVARLINLLQTEIKPILDNTQQTVQTARGTVDFVSSNISTPIVRIGGFMAGAGVLIENWFGLRRAIRRAPERRRTDEPA